MLNLVDRTLQPQYSNVGSQRTSYMCVCVCVDLCSDEATRAQPGAAREQTGAAKRLQTQFRCAKEGKRQKLSRFTLCVCREKGADVLTKEFGETWPSSLAGPSHA